MMCSRAERLPGNKPGYRGYLAVALLSGVAMLGACSGDGRPFEEAVEVQMLELVSLAVIAPDRTIDPFFAVNQVVDFRVRGTNTSGGQVDISGFDRQWRVSDPSIASIDDNGRLVGRVASAAPISVDLVIGSIVAESYSLNISDAPLQSVSSIEGADSLNPCLPMPYSAVGLFTDSMRPLTDVAWSVSPTDSARIGASDAGVISLNGVLPGDVQLTAVSGGFDLEKPITILQTLSAIDVTPVNLGLRVGSTRDMVATGSYMDGVVVTPPLPGGTPPSPSDDSDAESGTNEADMEEPAGTVATSTASITENVFWEITGGTNLATISNAAGTRGVISATSDGTVTVSASCGAIVGSGTLTITEQNGGDSSSGLSFEADEIDNNGELVLSLSDDRAGVRVELEDSDGDTVTTRADWQLSTNSSDTTNSTPIISVGNSISDKGLIIPLRQGTQDVRVTFDGAVATLTVQVIQ